MIPDNLENLLVSNLVFIQIEIELKLHKNLIPKQHNKKKNIVK